VTGFGICASCGHVRALHWNPDARLLTRPPVCHRYRRRTLRQRIRHLTHGMGPA
jgi:hypothetical protein